MSSDTLSDGTFPTITTVPTKTEALIADIRRISDMKDGETFLMRLFGDLCHVPPKYQLDHGDSGLSHYWRELGFVFIRRNQVNALATKSHAELRQGIKRIVKAMS